MARANFLAQGTLRTIPQMAVPKCLASFLTSVRFERPDQRACLVDVDLRKCLLLHPVIGQTTIGICPHIILLVAHAFGKGLRGTRPLLQLDQRPAEMIIARHARGRALAPEAQIVLEHFPKQFDRPFRLPNTPIIACEVDKVPTRAWRLQAQRLLAVCNGMRIILQLLIADGTHLQRRRPIPLGASGQLWRQADRFRMTRSGSARPLPSLVNFVFSVCWQALVSRTGERSARPVFGVEAQPASRTRMAAVNVAEMRGFIADTLAMVRSGRRAWSSGGVIDPWSVQRTVVWPSASRCTSTRSTLPSESPSRYQRGSVARRPPGRQSCGLRREPRRRPHSRVFPKPAGPHSFSWPRR